MMIEATDLEFMREVFKDVRLNVGYGTILSLSTSTDRSEVLVSVSTMPDGRGIIATMTWAATGNNAGFYSYPEVGDMVIFVNVLGHPDLAYVIATCNSVEELIPVFATLGHMVAYANAGKKLYLGSDTKVAIGRPGIEPSEPLVLGNVLTTFLTDLLDLILDAPQIGFSAFGPVWLDPGIRSGIISYMTTYLSNSATNIVSQIGFTERGE